jgi:hypothetical protein
MTCLALAAVAIADSGQSRAEVSADAMPYDVGVIVLGIIEGPDPIPQVIWTPIRDIDEELFLDPDGGIRGDGPPDIGIDPVTGNPHVVWAYDTGTDFDIAYAYWSDGGWSEVEFLSWSSHNELDPRIHVDEDKIHVVWWEQSTSVVRLISRSRNGDWSLDEIVEGHVGVRPSVVTWDGSMLIASETPASQGNKQILVSTGEGPDFDQETVGTVAGEEALRVVLHAEQGRLWMDWRHSATEFAYTEYDGGDWGPVQTIPWADESWLSFGQARLLIRLMVLANP